ncbi:MAG: hypothetical protein HQL13_00065, partial [Candidatus Omnitrophica bacterium]|nr:hypothetical protein [Candidatus Omnitrophota bacterium]
MILRLLLIIFFFGGNIWARAEDLNDDLFNYSKKHDEALVVKVIASDMIVLEDGRHVHLIGVESLGEPPAKMVKYDEKGHVIELPEEPTISLQEQAYAYAQELL